MEFNSSADTVVRALCVGRLAYCSAHTGVVVGDDSAGPIEELTVALDRLGGTLNEVGVDLGAVRHMRMYLIDLNYEQPLRELVSRRIPTAVAMTVVPVSAIGAEPGVWPAVAVDAVAELSEDQNTVVC